ncbi:UDP-2,3-diacylglucosamine diphosphatase [bacterium]|nr:UDP-2,3-diacylglucosamine diphosphatase [bacterium]
MNEIRQHPAPAAGSPPEPTVVFVSDSHFHLEPDADERARLDRFCELLAWSRGADRLVLLGDIFDFWFDYPHFRLRGYDRLLTALDEVRAAGTEITFIGGNHDIWAARYFHDRYGCHADGEPLTLQLGRRRVLLTHGDGLLKFDWAYNSFRAVVRTRLGVLLAKSLHPEILFALSTWLSGHSRGATRDEASAIERMADRWFDRAGAPDWDLMIMGHVHHGLHLHRSGREMVALAGWFSPLSYGLLRDGEFRLLEMGAAPLPELRTRA